MQDQDAINANPDMIWRKPWRLLRSGAFDQGLQIMSEEFKTKPGARETLRLGIGYMWAERYDSAAAHFIAAAHSQRNGENDFAYAGAAQWHLRNMPAAIQLWREGLKAQYAIGCRVCSMTARLLVVASALEPDQFSRDEAESILLDAMKRIDPSSWSGALGRFILGRFETSEMEPHWVGNIARGVKGVLSHRRWLTDFYAAVRRLNSAEIDVAEFRTLMRPMADAASLESTDLGTFIDLLRNSEFFIARTEAAKSD